MHSDHIASYVAFRSAETLANDTERAFLKFCKRVERQVGFAATIMYEDDILGMYEAGSSPEEVAEEIKHIDHDRTAHLPYVYLYPVFTVRSTEWRVMYPVDDFGNEVDHMQDEWNERDPLTGAPLNPAFLAAVAFFFDGTYHAKYAEGIYR
jgi:hypothetical protein